MNDDRRRDLESSRSNNGNRRMGVREALASASTASDARLRVCVSFIVMVTWTVFVGRRYLFGTGPATPPELSIAFTTLVAYLLGTGAKKKDEDSE
jgi:hypothetical protein